MRIFSIFLLVNAVLGFACNQSSTTNASESSESAPATMAKLTSDSIHYSKAHFAAGCFWCEEGVFESVKGVAEVISGYSGGHTKNPTYEQVNTETTGHAESVEVYYDSSKIDYPTLLKVYFHSMDPTQVKGQGPDIGDSYRSIIFYNNEHEKQLAQHYIDSLNQSGEYKRPIAVELKPFEKFWPAEDYHQNYIQKHPNDNPYVLHESIPRIKKFQRQFPELIKPERNLVKN